MKRFTTLEKFFLVLIILYSLALTVRSATAGSIKTWSNEVLTYPDLNSNFNHLHNSMVGGHGARLVNADVSASAAIAHTKLATPALVAKGFTSSDTICSGAGACTQTASSGNIASVTRGAGAGDYTVAFTSARPNNDYGVYLTGGAAGFFSCRWVTKTTTDFVVACRDAAGAGFDVALEVLVFDNDT